MKMELMKEFRFEASHILPKHPGKCSRLHGHSWVLRVYVAGRVNQNTGFVQDYADIKSIVQPLVDKLDHRHLGTYGFFRDDYTFMERWGLPELKGVYPSSENLLVWIAGQLDGVDTESSMWSKVELLETCTSGAVLTRGEFDVMRAGLEDKVGVQR